MKNFRMITAFVLFALAASTMQGAVTSRLRITLTGNGSANSEQVMLRVADEAAYATDFPNTGSATAYDIAVRQGSTYYAEWQQPLAGLNNTMIAVNPAVGTTSFTLTFKLGTTNTETFTFFDSQEMTTPITVTSDYAYNVTIAAPATRDWILNRFYINYNPAEVEVLPAKIGTFIRAKNVVDVQGGLFYEILEGTAERITFQSLADEHSLTEGTPVLYVAQSAGSMQVTYGSNTYSGSATSPIAHNGFVGLISGSQTCYNTGGTDAALINSASQLVFANATFTLTEGHAYIDLNNLPVAATPAPGRRRLTIGRQGVVTDLGEVNTVDTQFKVLDNGVMYIIKDGVKYNVMGQIVK